MRSFNYNIESLVVFIEQLNNIYIISLTKRCLENDDYPKLYFNN